MAVVTGLVVEDGAKAVGDLVALGEGLAAAVEGRLLGGGQVRQRGRAGLPLIAAGSLLGRHGERECGAEAETEQAEGERPHGQETSPTRLIQL